MTFLPRHDLFSARDSGPRLSPSMFREPFRQLPGGSARPAIPAFGRAALAPLALGLTLLALAGCQSDEITKYRVPREQAALTRLLGAVIPRGEKTWFVKLSGPEEAVKEQEGSFEQFVKSIRFPAKGEPPITWKAPEGWTRQAGEKPLRFATFEVGPRDHPLEVTVSAFGGSVLANVNRWRGQLGLPDVDERGLADIAHDVDLDGAKATLVSLTGRGPGKMALKQQATDERPRRPEPVLVRPKLGYKVPEGWKELPARGFRVAAFDVADGDQRAEVTVIPLPRQGLLDNVNRWRDQLGLAPIDAEQLKQDVQQLKAAGGEAPYVDLLGPEKAAGPRLRLLAVPLDRGEQTWFFKMYGHAELVGRQKAAFESFVASVRFPGGGGNER
jgi:hypothetical protein